MSASDSVDSSSASRSKSDYGKAVALAVLALVALVGVGYEFIGAIWSLSPQECGVGSIAAAAFCDLAEMGSGLGMILVALALIAAVIVVCFGSLIKADQT